MNKHFDKNYTLLKPFLNGLSLFLGILFLGLMSCSIVADYTLDAPPTVTISTNKSLEIDKTGTITFTFSEEVNGFTKNDVKFSSDDFSVNDIVISNFITNNPKKYSLDITPKVAGTLTISIPVNSFYDLSDNQNTNSFSTNFSVEEEKTPPTVTISTNKSLEIDKTGTITFTFSEEVNGFTKNDVKFSSDDFSVNEITIGNFITNSSKEYSLDITPKVAGTLTISIPANSFYDLSDNQNTNSFSNNFSVEEDKTPPTVTISTNKSLEIDKTGTITFTFSEEVNGFTKNDVKFSSDDFSVNDIVISNFITNNPKKYSLDITPKVAGTLTISIPANSFYDLSDNQNTNSFSNNFSVKDNIPPTVNISTNKSLEIDKTGTITFAFSEEVNGFTKNDVKFSSDDFSVNSVNDIVITNFITNNPKKYSLDITPKVAGTLTISIPANSFEDLSGNQNDKPYSSNFTVLDSTTTIHTISFKLNGGSFISSQITTLKVVSNTAIEETKLGGILSYPPTGPKPSIQAVTRDIFEWRNNNTRYDFSTLVSSDLTLEAVWSNSCGEIETFHPANNDELQNYVDAAVADSTTNLNHIDTSAITDMNNLFNGKSSFNGKIDCWNTANVTNMRFMFSEANAFNQDISSWNVANVTDMNRMFDSALVFNQNLSNWDVANVTDMNRMFDSALVFNQNLSNWDVANVTTMRNMFKDAKAFNQDIGSWNVANVNNMRNMFNSATSFNQNLSSWSVNNVTNHTNMFLSSPMANETNKHPVFNKP